MNKTLIAAFSVVVIPLGLVVSASATDPIATHTVSYTVEPLRAISVEPRLGGGSADIDFGTIAKTGVKTNIDLRVKVTAEDAGVNNVKVSVAMDPDPGTGIVLTVSAGTMVNGNGNPVTHTFPETEGLSLVESPQDLITSITGTGGTGGLLNAFSDLTYTLTATNATSSDDPVVHTVTYTLATN